MDASARKEAKRLGLEDSDEEEMRNVLKGSDDEEEEDAESDEENEEGESFLGGRPAVVRRSASRLPLGALARLVWARSRSTCPRR